MIYPVANWRDYWPAVAPLLRKAVERGHTRYALSDVCEALDAHTMQLSVAVIDNQIIAAMVTEVIDYPQARAFRAVFVGGDTGRIDEWLPDFDEHMDIGAANVGADIIEAHGRLGWLKKMRAFCGAEEVTTIITRPVRRATVQRAQA